ncbi:hypothetical protein [Devosia faecipullorum]|uniref:hypothetical protein n=1 Tax=Devosia faecipullorum TaxID=2755039 RepID=UPI00187B958E|nr:hypothetical protein [Devosia faecipullorum]MBE7732145.1 hypothetical protein [Devosia faecipullorum]
MSDNISVRIDLGVAKLEFAGVQIEQPIGITLELPRDRIAELILGGAAINPVVAKVEPAPVPAVVTEPTPEPRHTLVRPRATAPTAVDIEDSRREEVGKLTSFTYDELRERLSTLTVDEAAFEFGVSASLIEEYRGRLGIAAVPEKAAHSPATAQKRRRKGKLSRYGDAYLREKISTMPAPFLAKEWDVSLATIYQHRKRLGIDGRAAKSEPVEVVERQSLTDYSDVELREMLSSKQWSSIAFDHGVSITAVIAEGKRLGVQQPIKAVEEVAHADTSFRLAAAEGAAHEYA